jgi:excisionase family DNA binding protein
MADTDRSPYYTVRQVAAIYQLHPQVVYRAIARGDIPVIRIGRALRIPRRVIDEELLPPRAVNA